MYRPRDNEVIYSIRHRDSRAGSVLAGLVLVSRLALAQPEIYYNLSSAEAFWINIR